MTHLRELNRELKEDKPLQDSVIGQGAGQTEEQNELYWHSDSHRESLTDRWKHRCAHTQMPQCTDTVITEDTGRCRIVTRWGFCTKSCLCKQKKHQNPIWESTLWFVHQLQHSFCHEILLMCACNPWFVGFFYVCFLLEHLNTGIPASTDTLFSHLFQHYVILRWNKTVKFPSFTVLWEIFFGINCTLIHM